MYFHFKEFTIRQRDSAMKVGTDGLLLATSTPLKEGNKKVLDIGTGTGMIALIIAQRDANAKLTAIEIDQAASEEAKFNFERSPFADRIALKHRSFADFVQDHEEDGFDLIVCNPPFFDGGQAIGSRNQARSSSSLPPKELLDGVVKLLSEEGQFSLIIPFQNERSFIELANDHKLFAFKILRVKGRNGSKVIRSIIHFEREKKHLEEFEMCIELDQRHDYSADYVKLTKDFLTIFD